MHARRASSQALRLFRTATSSNQAPPGRFGGWGVECRLPVLESASLSLMELASAQLRRHKARSRTSATADGCEA